MSCKLAQLPLDQADRELLDRWTATGLDTLGRKVSGDVLCAALRADGHPVGPTTVKAHRAGRCACHKD